MSASHPIKYLGVLITARFTTGSAAEVEAQNLHSPILLAYLDAALRVEVAVVECTVPGLGHGKHPGEDSKESLGVHVE